MNKLRFHELATTSALTDRRNLSKFLLSIFSKEGAVLKRVDIIFCTDEFLYALNKDFLNHNYFTDTISFLLSETREPLIGEVYISIDRVKDNSNKQKIPYKKELIRIVIHGILHLCGYLDKPKSAALKMYKAQEEYLNKWMFHVEQQIKRNVSRET